MTETTPAERSAVWRDDNLQPADRLAAIRKRHAVLAARTWEATPHQHGASGCRCLSCYDDPTGWQIDHPAALDCEELVATTSNDFGRKRGSCEAGPLLSYDEADALARAADDIGFLLDLAAATVPASAPTDRAAVLREAAEALGRMDYDTDNTDYGYDTYRDAWNGGVMDGAAELRRLAEAASGPGGAAGETQQDERPRCPHCQMPHDLTPDVAAVCASIRASIVDSRAQQAGCGRCGHGQAAHNVSGCTECPGGWRADHRFALADPPCAQHPTAPVIGGMCGGCTQYPADFPKRLPPMDPIHILGIEADEQPAAVSQPGKEA